MRKTTNTQLQYFYNIYPNPHKLFILSMSCYLYVAYIEVFSNRIWNSVCLKMNWSLTWKKKVKLAIVNRSKEQAASVLFWGPQIFLKPSSHLKILGPLSRYKK